MSNSLLNRFNLTIDQLTYEYINECKDKKTLERIVKVLRSGEEGFFPDLLRITENRLAIVAPNSDLILTPEVVPYKDDIPDFVWNDLENDLKDWEKDIKRHDQVIRDLNKEPLSLPPVRNVTKIKKVPCSQTIDQATRIRRDEYNKWDKFNVEEELTRMDVEEERLEEQKKKMKLEQKKNEKQIVTSLMNNNICVNINEISEAERTLLAEKAREKGNEYFKAQDLQTALAFYDESLAYQPTKQSLNNRAITYIKLGRYADAIADCTKVLDEEPTNVKALLRRATAYEHSATEKDWRRGCLDLEAVIAMEPKNQTAQSVYETLRSKLKIPAPKVRLKIEDAPQIPKERLPLLYYGPSTSTFRCEPGSLQHQMLTRSRYSVHDIPCWCNGGETRENPLCRYCGESRINHIKNQTQATGNTNPWRNAEVITRLCKERKTNFLISPTPRSVVKTTESGISHPFDDVPDGSCKASTVPEQPSNYGSNKVESPTSSSTPSVTTKTKLNGGKEKILAEQAFSRGDACFQLGNYTTALAYYSTSIKLCADTPALLARANAHIKLARYSEAVCDCSRVLDTDPDNSNALLRRATAYSAMPDSYYWKLGLEDLEKVVSVRLGDESFRSDVNTLMQILLSRKRLFSAETDSLSGTTKQHEMSNKDFEPVTKTVTPEFSAVKTKKKQRYKDRKRQNLLQQEIRITKNGKEPLTPENNNQIDSTSNGQLSTTKTKKNQECGQNFKKIQQNNNAKKNDVKATKSVPTSDPKQLDSGKSNVLKKGKKVNGVTAQENDRREACTYNTSQPVAENIVSNKGEETEDNALHLDHMKNRLNYNNRSGQQSQQSAKPLKKGIQNGDTNNNSASVYELGRPGNNDFNRENKKHSKQDKQSSILDPHPNSCVKKNAKTMRKSEVLEQDNCSSQAPLKQNNYSSSGGESLKTTTKENPRISNENKDFLNDGEVLRSPCKGRKNFENTASEISTVPSTKKKNTHDTKESPRSVSNGEGNTLQNGKIAEERKTKAEILVEDRNLANKDKDVAGKGTKNLKGEMSVKKTDFVEEGMNEISLLKSNVEELSAEEILPLEENSNNVNSNKKTKMNWKGSPETVECEVVSNEIASGDKILTCCKALPSSYQFYARWEECRKRNAETQVHLAILQSVPPVYLPSVIGEKLDAQMLSELLVCLETLAVTDEVSSVEYLLQLPNLKRIGVVKLFLEPYDDQRAKRLIELLDNHDVTKVDCIKKTLL